MCVSFSNLAGITNRISTVLRKYIGMYYYHRDIIIHRARSVERCIATVPVNDPAR